MLFAVQEVVHESLGFSPNELMFGHHARGPLSLLREREVVAGPHLKHENKSVGTQYCFSIEIAPPL